MVLGISSVIHFSIKMIFNVIKSDQGAGVLALCMILVNIFTLTTLNQLSTLILTLLSIIWVAVKLHQSIIESKKLKEKKDE